MTAYSAAVFSPAMIVPQPTFGPVFYRNQIVSSSASAVPAVAMPDEVLCSVLAQESSSLASAVPAVLSEELFQSVVSRERKRADRFDEVFALGTLTFGCPGSVIPPDLKQPIVEALQAVTREADVIGWVEQDAILGVIFADIERPGDDTAQQVKARVESELAARVEPGVPSRLNLHWYVHAGPGRSGSAGLSETDPLLEDIRSEQQRRTGMDALKRAIDIVGSALLLVLLAPVFAAVALLVKLTSRGPVLFRQERVGHLAKPFTMLKFRSMHTEADPMLHQQFVTEFINSRGDGSDGDGKLFKIVNDPRTTPIGRFLRKTSLDELPQLWNVLRGDMSLVGPRPPLPYELEQYRSWHWRRVLEAKPGVTGLWQVAGRSETRFDEMVRLDLRYVRSRSLWTDLKILLATPWAVITGKGAC